MTTGLEIFNPSTGNLIIHSEMIGYRYNNQPTLITSGSVTRYHQTLPPGTDYWYGTVNPYEYEITLPSNDIPIIAIKLKTSAIVELIELWNVSGNTWRFRIRSVTTSSAWDSMATINVVAPDVYVFCRYVSADNVSGTGLQIFNSSGGLVFSTQYKPLWINQVLDFPQDYAGYLGNPFYSWTNYTLYSSDQSAAISSLSIPLLMTGGGNAQWNATNYSSGEDIYFGSAGWMLSGSNLKRVRYITEHTIRADPTPDDSITYQLYATKAIIIDGSVL